MRLIDADRALEIVRDQGIAHPSAYHLTNYATLILREAPTVDAADVAPVRHGKWTSIGYDCGENEYQCSECRRTEWRESADDMKFCMFCGAMMDGGADNER